MYDIIYMVNNMNSRMERYNSNYEDDNTALNETPSRVQRNNNLYQDIRTSDLSRVRSDDNVRVIDNAGKTIDIDKIRRYVNEINEQPRSNRRSVFVPTQEDVRREDNNSKPKDYDLNSVLEKAKQSREIDYDRERYKKLRDTQYDILNKLDTYQVKDEIEDDLLTLDDFNTEEKTVIDLINTVTIHNGDVNLLEELMGGDGDETTLPIKEELEIDGFKKDVKDNTVDYGNTTVSNLLESISNDPEIANSPLISTKPIKKLDNVQTKTLNDFNKTQELVNLKEKDVKVDNSFYTSSMSFSKEDFEGFDELEKSVKKNGILTTVIVVFMVVVIIVSLVVILNYVLKLGLF